MASEKINHLDFIKTDASGTLIRFINDAQSLVSHDHKALLASLPDNVTSSFAPLAALSYLLDILSGPWPILDLQRAYTQAWKLLPEAAKAGRASPIEQRLIEHTLAQCKNGYSSLLDLHSPASDDVAIIDPETGRSITHSKLSLIVETFRLPPRSVTSSKPVVAVSLPNGALLATVVLAATTYYTVAPVAHGSGVGKEQFKADVLQSHSDVVLASKQDVVRLGLAESWLSEAGVEVYIVELDQRMNLIVRELNDHIVSHTSTPPRFPRPAANYADNIGILLFTSGTSGTKKLVPLSIHSMVCGVAMVVKSWGLTTSMRCLNQMPLNHVGGLVRNLFAPVFSGGSVICCSGFDANLFWDCVEDHRPTWYYASPSMHQCILETGRERPESLAQNQIRLICNAAGGLLPSLAVQLRDTFSTKSMDCTVLPSYGMTECMPISTPPLDYRLQKTGTSGISVGPEIAILDGLDKLEGVEKVGRVAVRGAPVFAGYLKNDLVVDSSCFTADGWFDTGDMGYLDSEGYLYITGRSKEVINRGGELISPFEVEEAIVAAAAKPDSILYGRISKALAFSVPHDVLQEVVGLAVVTPEGSHRACLRGIQEAVKSVLSQVKVPVLLVYMDEGLPTNNNKILRIRLAERLGMATIMDSTPAAGRYFEAVCPPPNTPLSTPITCNALSISHSCLQKVAESLVPASQEVFVRRDPSDFYPEIIIAPSQADVLTEKHSANTFEPQQLVTKLYSLLHGYNTPLKARYLSTVFPRKNNGDIDESTLVRLLDEDDSEDALEDLAPTEAAVAKVFAQVLGVPLCEISSTSHFFDLGGDSMGAGRLLTAIRKKFPLRLPIDVLFANPLVSQLAHIIDERLAADQKPLGEKGPIVTESELLPGCEKTCSSTNPFLLIFQLLPLVALWPMKRALTWTVFMYVMTASQNWPTNNSIPGRLVDLVISMAVGRIVTRIVGPLVAIAFKWLVIGQHKEGLYPMWGQYHTRWWIVEKFTAICGTGVFGLSNMTLIWYYRLLGARIGKNVKLQKAARLGEWDLITIEDDAVIERATVRPFAAERNTSMYLGRINIGAKASIGLGAIVAAGTTVPANACIGPNSSSWEVADADEANRDLASSSVPGAHWALNAFIGVPLSVINAFFTALPWLACLVALVVREPDGAFEDQLQSVLIWFSSPTRVAWHYCALVAHAAFAPAFGFACVLVIKAVFDRSCGRITPTPVAARSQMTNFRMQLMQTLMPAATFHKLTELFGTHYDTTSILARALGAKVGKRVYWPGTGPSIQNFELLDIGDDVVFGSRSHLVTSDGMGSDYVRIGSGAMVADRVVLLPGSKLGEKTIMGSGALAKRDKAYADGTTWVGSKNNEAICLSSDAPRTGETGHRAEQYYETIKAMGPQYMPGNSTATTLVRTVPDSERSSMHLIEKSPNPAVRALSYLEHLRNGSKTPSSTASRKTSVSMTGHRHVISSASSVTGVYPGISSEVYEMSPMPQSSEPAGSSSPFGRAFYEGKADYHVWSQFTIFCYSTLVAVITATWWNAGSIAAVQVVGHLFREHNWLTLEHGFLNLHNTWRPAHLFVFFWALIVAVMTFQSVVVIAITIAAKWIIIGRRAKGNYDWDKSSYCQRWQLFLKLETLRRRCYGNMGILGLLTGTHYMTMYFRALGAEIGSDCALFASGNPSLMFTEPDLLTLGDRVAVDDASLVGHINTRGKFDLNPLVVGSRSVLRTGSRLLSGATMEEDSCLLEHTLVMAGDVVDKGVTMQGWPAEEFKAKRTPTLEISRLWTVAEV